MTEEKNGECVNKCTKCGLTVENCNFISDKIVVDIDRKNDKYEPIFSKGYPDFDVPKICKIYNKQYPILHVIPLVELYSYFFTTYYGKGNKAVVISDIGAGPGTTSWALDTALTNIRIDSHIGLICWEQAQPFNQNLRDTRNYLRQKQSQVQIIKIVNTCFDFVIDDKNVDLMMITDIICFNNVAKPLINNSDINQDIITEWLKRFRKSNNSKYLLFTETDQGSKEMGKIVKYMKASGAKEVCKYGKNVKYSNEWSKNCHNLVKGKELTPTANMVILKI